MNLLIIGSDSELGQSMRKISQDYEHDFTFVDAKELDITSEEQINSFFKENHFDFAINCASFMDMDAAENDYDAAFALNCLSPYLIAKCAKKYKVRFIHISTSHVFDGQNGDVYYVDSEPKAKNVYGSTSLQGEKKVLRCNKDAKIIRTSWLYSEFGNIFIDTILSLSRKKSSLEVIFDYISSPTYATDLAKTIMKMVSARPIGTIFHFSNEGVCSLYDFARKIVELKGLKCKILPVISKNHPMIAKRPHSVVLDKTDIKLKLRCEIPHWEESLAECMKLISEQ